MTDAEARRFGELRSLLQQAPSEEVWEALCAQLAAWPAEELEAGLSYAAAVLDRWPTEPLRQLPAGWFDALVHDRAPLAASLITTFEIVGHIKPDLFWELLRRAPLERLRALALEPYPALDEAGCGTLAAQPLRALERLTLRRSALGDAGLARLAEASWFGGLRWLDVSECRLADPARWVEALRAAPLERLHISHNHIQGGVGSLMGERWARLEVIEWYGSWLTRAEAGRLTREVLPRLHTLRMSGTRLGDEGVAALVSGPLMAGLVELHLTWSRLGAEAARALAASPEARGLRALSLAGNEALGVEGARALAASPWLGGLEALDLNECGLTDAGAALLLDTSALTSLRRVCVLNNQLSPEVAAACEARWPWGR